MTHDHVFYLNPNEVERLQEMLRCEQKPLGIDKVRWTCLKYGLHFTRPFIKTSELKAIVDAISFEVVNVLRSA